MSHNRINCRIGSLENWNRLRKAGKTINRRIGGLEMTVRLWQPDIGINRRIGGLEKGRAVLRGGFFYVCNDTLLTH